MAHIENIPPSESAKSFEAKNPADEEKRMLKKSFDELDQLARLNKVKKGPKEKEIYIKTGDREKAIRKFAEDNDLSEKFVKRNYNILIIYSKKEKLGRAMFKKRELPRARALKKAMELSKRPFYCVADTKKEAIKQAVERLAYDSELTPRAVKRYFKFRIILGGPADLTKVRYFRKRP